MRKFLATCRQGQIIWYSEESINEYTAFVTFNRAFFYINQVDIDNLLSSVSEGGMNFASGATYNETVLQLVKDLGVGAQPLRLDLTTATRQYTQAANVAGFGLNGTPFQQTLLASRDMINKFKSFCCSTRYIWRR